MNLANARLSVRHWVWLLPALVLLGPAPTAHATDFEWNGGLFSLAGVPNPLTAPDTVVMSEPSDAPVFDLSFVNKSLFGYNDSNLVFGDGVTVTNDGTWVSLEGHGLLRNNAVTVIPTFINNGTFSSRGGPTNIVNIVFVNNGVIHANLGTISLNSPFKTFNNGTQFQATGSGRNEIRNGGQFNGSFKSDHLELIHGTYTGDSATLTSGSVDWTAGVFVGTWTNAGTFRARDTGGARHWGDNVSFTNDGVFSWLSGELTLGSNARLVNNLLYEATPTVGRTATAFKWTGGAVRPTVTNTGTFRNVRAAGDPSSILHVGSVHFVNFGTIDATGTALHVVIFNGPATFESGSSFAGQGQIQVSFDATFKGAFTSSGALHLVQGRFTGLDAKMNGAVTWSGGTLADTWTNAGELRVQRGIANKRVAGSFVNEGDITLTGDGNDVIDIDRFSTFENRRNVRSAPAAQQFRTIGTAQPGSRFVNSGNFVHEGPGSTRVSASHMQNSGTVTLLGGRLTFAGGVFNQNGEVRLEAATLGVDGMVNFGNIRGTGRIEGDFDNFGHVDPGLSPGTLLVQGDYVHGAGAVLNIELQDSAVFDRFVIDGNAELLGGDLALHCLGACDLQVGDRFDVFAVSGDLTGSFDTFTLHGFGAGWQFDLRYDYGADGVLLEVLQVGAVIPVPSALVLFAGPALLIAAGKPRAAHRAARASECSPV